MKGHKAHRKHHSAGGAESPKSGTKEWEMDLAHKTHDRVSDPEEEHEADEKKHGGRAKRKRGGHVHHEHGKHLGHAKHLGHVEGMHSMHHAGRKPRKSGGCVGSNMNPLSSAHKGMEPKGHKSEANE